MNIYILDDEETITDLLRRILSKNGHQSSTFNNPADFIESFKLQKEKIDLAVIDVNLPEMSGVDVLKIILTEKPELKVIMMTGENNSEKAEEMKQVGATGFLGKPFTIAEVNKIIQNINTKM